MFNNDEIKKLKKKYETEQKKFNAKNKSLNKLNGFLNTFDYKEFMPLYIPSEKNESTFIFKPLPFVNVNRDKISSVSIPFSKHLSKDKKYNCSLNISDNCEICNSGLIKKFDFVIFPVYVLKNSNNDYFKNKIFLLELSTEKWNEFIFPFIEKIYNENYIVNLKLIRNKYTYNYYIDTNEEYEIPFLTTEEIFNKSFIEDNIKKYLYNEKAYEKHYKLNIKKDDIIIIET